MKLNLNIANTGRLSHALFVFRLKPKANLLTEWHIQHNQFNGTQHAADVRHTDRCVRDLLVKLALKKCCPWSCTITPTHASQPSNDFEINKTFFLWKRLKWDFSGLCFIIYVLDYNGRGHGGVSERRRNLRGNEGEFLIYCDLSRYKRTAWKYLLLHCWPNHQVLTYELQPASFWIIPHLRARKTSVSVFYITCE